MKVDLVTAPAGWASALVNGDESLFDHSDDATDRAAYVAFCAWLVGEGLSVADVARDEGGEGMEPRFTWNGKLHHSAYAGCDVIDYVVYSAY